MNLIKAKPHRLKIGNKCNNNCIYCGVLNIKNKCDKSLEKIKKELKSLKEKNYTSIIFPCNTDIRADFFEIMEYAKNLRLSISLETNGRMFCYHDFAQKVAGNVDEIRVFLNGTSWANNKICGTDSFNQTIRGIKNLVKSGMEVCVYIVITNYNYQELEQIVNKIYGLKVNEYRIVFPVLKKKEEYIPEVADCYHYIDRAIKLTKKHGMNVVTGELFYNSYILEDLNLDYSTAVLKYDYPLDTKETTIEVNPSLISFIRIDASSMCQLKCPLCKTGTGFNKRGVIGSGYLKFENFKEFVSKNPEINKVELSNYGEMFLNPDLNKIIKCAFGHSIKLIARNGVNLNTLKECTAKVLAKYKFISISVSLDGATEDTYKIYRKGGDFSQVIKNIEKINFYKKKYNSEFPKLIWQFVVFDHNKHEIQRAKKMAKKLNMRFFVRANWASIQNEDKIRVISAEESSGMKKEFGSGYSLLVCDQLWRSPQINWDGKLLGCCRNMYSDFGNVFSQGLKECLQGERYVYTKKMLLGDVKARNDIPCSKCKYFKEKHLQKWLGIESLKDKFLPTLTSSIYISVIIPTYNKKDLLKLTLISLFNQNYPKDQYEIIVVNDGGSDNPLDMIKKLKPTCSFKYIYWPRCKPYKFGEPGNRAGPARNLGAGYAKGEILMFIDSDIIADSDLLKNYTKKPLDDETVIMGVRKLLTKEATPDKLICLINKGGLGKGNSWLLPLSYLDKYLGKQLVERNYNIMAFDWPWKMFMSYCFIITKKTFESVGGFDHNFVFWGNEDQELAYRLLKERVRFKINERAVVYHQFHEAESKNEEVHEKTKKIHTEILYKKHLDKSIFDCYRKSYFHIIPRKRFLFFTTNGVGLGHINRTSVIAREIPGQRRNAGILFLTRTQDFRFLDRYNLEYIGLPELAPETYSNEREAVYEVVKRFKPHVVIIDTMLTTPSFPSIFFEDDMKKIKKVLILRKQENNIIRHFLLHYSACDLKKVIIPHTEYEFSSLINDKKLFDKLKKFNLVFTGPVCRGLNGDMLKAVKKDFGIKKGEWVIVVTGGAGGHNRVSESPTRIYKNVSDIYYKLTRQIKNLKMIIILGPHFNEEIKINKRIIVKKYEENMLELMSCANLIISSAGYNICNEILYLKRPAILMPLERRSNDQIEKALYLRKEFDFDVIEKNQEELLYKKIINYYEKKKISNYITSDNFIAGNKKAAKEIINV